MKIIGITGTLGAGKGTIVNYLVHNKGYIHFSVRTFLTQEIISRKLSVNRNSMVLVANDLRATHSPSYITDCLYKEAKKKNKNCVIESIRTPGEILSLRSTGSFLLLAVDADKKIRYQRILMRKSETDHISFDEFIENENREMTSDDPNKQNLRKCIEMADILVENNGNKEQLYQTLEQIL